jgi:hypothetical protein
LELALGLVVVVVVVWRVLSDLVFVELGTVDVRVLSDLVLVELGAVVVAAGRVVSVLEAGATVFCESERELLVFTLGVEFSLVVVVVSVLVDVLVEIPDSRVLLLLLILLLSRVLVDCLLPVVGAERGLLYSLLI